MLPRILEYEDDIVKVTAEAYAIAEVKALIDKYGKEVQPYLAFVHGMSAHNSPYLNVPDTERRDGAIYDIQSSYGDFDFDDPLVEEAIEKLRSLYASPVTLMVEQLGEEIHKLRKYLRDSEIREGKDGNLTDRRGILKDINSYLASYENAKKMADEEISIKMKGSAQLGEY